MKINAQSLHPPRSDPTTRKQKWMELRGGGLFGVLGHKVSSGFVFAPPKSSTQVMEVPAGTRQAGAKKRSKAHYGTIRISTCWWQSGIKKPPESIDFYDHASPVPSAANKRQSMQQFPQQVAGLWWVLPGTWTYAYTHTPKTRIQTQASASRFETVRSFPFPVIKLISNLSHSPRARLVQWSGGDHFHGSTPPSEHWSSAIDRSR